MSKSLIDTILPYLVIGGFLGILFLCACGLLITACLRFYKLEACRFWRIASFSTLAYTGLSLLSIATNGVATYQQIGGSMDPIFPDSFIEVLSEIYRFSQSLMFIFITVALANPLLKSKQLPTIQNQANPE